MSNILKSVIYQVRIFFLKLFNDVSKFFEETDCSDVSRDGVVVKVEVVVLQTLYLGLIINIFLMVKRELFAIHVTKSIV